MEVVFLNYVNQRIITQAHLSVHNCRWSRGTWKQWDRGPPPCGRTQSKRDGCHMTFYIEEGHLPLCSFLHNRNHLLVKHTTAIINIYLLICDLIWFTVANCQSKRYTLLSNCRWRLKKSILICLCFCWIWPCDYCAAPPPDPSRCGQMSSLFRP